MVDKDKDITFQEENDYKYCQNVVEGKCSSCIEGYKLSQDNKCSLSYNCKDIKDGNCIICEDNYFKFL
jgi:hypothetical protein